MLRETCVILAGELVCLGLMWLVFALLGRLDRPVWLGGISYILRLAGIFSVLFVLVKSGVFQPFDIVLPLVFVRPVITLASFFRKKPEPPQAAPEPDAEDED